MGNERGSRSACSHDRDLLSADVHTIEHQITHECGAIGVIAKGASILNDDGVHRPHDLGSFRDFVEKGQNEGLAGGGHVIAEKAHGGHAAHGVLQTIVVYIKGDIGIVEPKMLEHSVVNLG